ncbi:MAG: hypothetical protein SVZ03_14365 [Spirochaetota bacterium]|nr:hypothetical protein [Spirochaetota bacterium]
MIIKYMFIIILVLLTLISISQIFSIPPFAEDIFYIYKSGYFSELEKEFDIIKDSFINIKMMSKAVYAWIFLQDISKKHEIDIRVYNRRGNEVFAPGEETVEENERVIRLLNTSNPDIISEAKGEKYYSAIPILIERRCRFCHTINNKSNIVGVMTFEREYNPYIYYSSERVILFALISTALSIILYFVVRWDPEKRIKRLFND